MAEVLWDKHGFDGHSPANFMIRDSDIKKLNELHVPTCPCALWLRQAGINHILNLYANTYFYFHALNITQ